MVKVRSIQGYLQKSLNYHALSEQKLFDVLSSSKEGLSTSQAERLLGKYGLNEIKIEKPVNPVLIFLRQFSSSLIWILLAALGISLFLEEFLDAVVIGVIIILNAVLGFVQEYKAEKTIQALRRLASPQAKVLRNGKEIRIDSKYLVPGDIIFLETGDKVPADARLFELYSLETQEASLTGESQPITKNVNPVPEKTIVADRRNMVYASTIITGGHGQAIVTATGNKTELGRIATLIQEPERSLTPLQKKIQNLGKYLTIAVLLMSIIIFLSGIFTGKEIAVMFLTTVTLAVAAVPEGLPAVITISLALGLQRLVKSNALIRTLPSVETLGSVNVICSDKTGTLTYNQMTVAKIWANNQICEVSGSGYEPEGGFTVLKKKIDPASIRTILTIGVLCNTASFVDKNNEREVIGDPTEAALLVSAEKVGFTKAALLQEFPQLDEVPFSSERKMMTTIHAAKKGTISYTKGAPDVIINLCNRIILNGTVHRFDRLKKKQILAQTEEFAEQALRVLGFAYNDKADDKHLAEQNMIFAGLQAMIDPPREEVKAAIKQCQEAGIRVIMITGDHLTTAKAIAKQLGIEGKAILGEEIRPAKLQKEIHEVGVFARVSPHHKMDIINALKANNYVVAMTGDGINDAPALKKADIGIAMGIGGTDVAKEASDMILLDDNFTSIVRAVEQGRGIFDNIRKFVKYLLSSNLGEVTLIFLATIFTLPLPLNPIHLLWINLVTDGFPAVALSLDPPEAGIMKRKPRKVREEIITKPMWIEIILLGLAIGVTTLILFWLYRDSPLEKAQTIAFTALVIFEIVRLQTIRSQYHLSLFSNRYLLYAIGGSLLLHLLVLYVPFLQRTFHVVSLEIVDWLWIFGATAVLIGISKGISVVRKSEL